MKILTIDPSMSHTALVLFELNTFTMEAKVVWSTTLNTEKANKKMQIRASSDLIGRCRELYRPTQEHIRQLEPDLIFAETPSGSQSASGMKSYGVSCFLLATLSPDPIEVTPIEVKKASVGSKTASKAEMIAWAFEKHPELQWKLDKSGKPQVTTEEHKADAVAVFYAGIQTSDFKRILSLRK